MWHGQNVADESPWKRPHAAFQLANMINYKHTNQLGRFPKYLDGATPRLFCLTRIHPCLDIDYLR